MYCSENNGICIEDLAGPGHLWRGMGRFAPPPSQRFLRSEAKLRSSSSLSSLVRFRLDRADRLAFMKGVSSSSESSKISGSSSRADACDLRPKAASKVMFAPARPRRPLPPLVLLRGGSGASSSKSSAAAVLRPRPRPRLPRPLEPAPLVLRAGTA